jgi:hypothetical protein
LHNLALFWVKNANFFAEIFGENIKKIIASVPDFRRLLDYCFRVYFTLGRFQGYQIERIFAYWASVFFRQIFSKFRNKHDNFGLLFPAVIVM